MSYAQLDVHFDEHPKFVALELEHFGLMACALAYCNRLLTDGALPEKAVRSFGASGRGVKLAERLVAAGLWERTADGFVIAGFLDHNPSRADVEAKREAARDRQRKYVRKNVVANAVADASSAPSVTEPLHFTVTDTSQSQTTQKNPPRASADVFADGSPDSYRAAMAEALGAPQGALTPWETKDLGGLLATHAGRKDGPDLKLWIGETARAFVAAGRARFGARPKHVAAWLDAGRPTDAPRKPSTLQGHADDELFLAYGQGKVAS